MAEKPHLLQIGEVTDEMAARLDAAFQVHVLFDAPDRAAFLAQVGATILAVATDGHWGVPSDVFAACPGLKVVSSYGVGYDGIDVPKALERGILVAHTPDVLNDEVADTAMMLWLALSRQLLAADAWARSGDWEAKGNFPLTRALKARKLGILGLGRIGETIAARAQAFGAEVHYHSRSQKPVDLPYHASALALAQAVDTLVVITPGGPATQNLVDAPVLEALGPEGTLINVSRGSVVDEAALVEALQSGKLGAAGLDVFAAEPQVPDALKAMPNVVLTPHVGSATHETRRAMGMLTCDNLLTFLDEGRVLTPIPECRAVAPAKPLS